MADDIRDLRIEPRWPVAFAIALTGALLSLLPGRVRIVPSWFVIALTVFVLVPMIGVTVTNGLTTWERLERRSVLLFAVVGGVGSVMNLAVIIRGMIGHTAPRSGLQLLASSIAIWVTNVLVFSLLYWQVDRGGPEARVLQSGGRRDWLFPQDGAPEGVAPPEWRPMYVDYLFVSFSTATAFSATNALPLAPRAMLLMMLESAISLVTIVIVAARSINVLGT